MKKLISLSLLLAFAGTLFVGIASAQDVELRWAHPPGQPGRN